MRSFFLLRLSACEREIMDILWSSGRSMSTNDVLELWEGEEKPSYSTVATHLTRLSHKNFVEYKKRSGDKTFYYSPAINRAKYHQRLAVSMCMLVVICLTTVAAVIVSLPVIRSWRNSEQQDVPKPVPAVKQPAAVVADTVEALPMEKDIRQQPSLPAEFEGGEEGIQRFFEEHWQGENEGRVYLRLLIDKKGVVREAKAVLDPSTNPELAKEAEAIAMQMPSWKPATENGAPVATRRTIAVVLLKEE